MGGGHRDTLLYGRRVCFYSADEAYVMVLKVFTVSVHRCWLFTIHHGERCISAARFLSSHGGARRRPPAAPRFACLSLDIFLFHFNSFPNILVAITTNEVHIIAFHASYYQGYTYCQGSISMERRVLSSRVDNRQFMAIHNNLPLAMHSCSRI